MADPTDDPRFLAAIKLLERTGLRQFQIRYQDDDEPTVWLAVGEWFMGPKGLPVAKGGRITWECAAALTPLRAVLRLCDEVMDGGTCMHCGKPTGVTEDFDAMPANEFICWYQYDPELATFRRGCA